MTELHQRYLVMAIRRHRDEVVHLVRGKRLDHAMYHEAWIVLRDTRTDMVTARLSRSSTLELTE
ncbi:hypothetical protein PG984_004773 [Apiospora sp. TS-2023a]